MSIETYTLLPFTSDEVTDPSSFVLTDKQKGAGYHGRMDTVHTAVFTLDSFKGTLKIQCTLSLQPSDEDWVDVINLELIDSTEVNNSLIRNFIGNWVWVRAAYVIEQGAAGIQYYI